MRDLFPVSSNQSDAQRILTTVLERAETKPPEKSDSVEAENVRSLFVSLMMDQD